MKNKLIKTWYERIKLTCSLHFLLCL